MSGAPDEASGTDGEPSPRQVASIPAGRSPADGEQSRDAWQALRRFTAARIALGRAGTSLPTARHLEFQLAHARARDAVHAALDADALERDLQALGLPTVRLHSAAPDRDTYLKRPDLGRRLDDASRARLAALAAPATTTPDAAALRYDVALVVADGLSAQAASRHAAPLVAALLPRLSDAGLVVAPVAVVLQGRVAVGDEVGERLGARLVVVLIGERPGLSSPDSLGAYLTWAPRAGLTDEARNCVSNVRPEGLAIEAAAQRIAWLIGQAHARGLSGVALKDETGAQPSAVASSATFLLPREP